MIRRTIARAFGRTLSGKLTQPVGAEAQEVTRARRAQVAFTELYEAFQHNIERRILTGSGDPQRRLSPIDQGAEGQQFVVEAPGMVCRVRNSMNGLLWMATQHEGGVERRQILSLHRDETESYQLISKDVGEDRSPFQFSSVPKLVEDVIGRAPDPVPPDPVPPDEGAAIASVTEPNDSAGDEIEAFEEHGGLPAIDQLAAAEIDVDDQDNDDEHSDEHDEEYDEEVWSDEESDAPAV